MPSHSWALGLRATMSPVTENSGGISGRRGQSIPAYRSALFPIVDPLAGSPIFLAMTQEYPTATRRALAWRVALNSLMLMAGSYFIGAHVLNFFGVSLPVVQVGGGLVVASMGWGMLLQKDESFETARSDVQCSDALHSAFYPLTLPLTVGPGSISVAITLGANATRRYG